MLNIEKYKEDILNMSHANITCCVGSLNNGEDCANKSCIECKKEALEWLLEKYKQPVLDDVEKEYLSAVIKPFRKKVKHIVKINLCSSPEEQFIKIVIDNLDFINFPNFNKNTGMYKGMEADKLYSLEELGL